MAGALRELSEDDLRLRRAEDRSRGPVDPSARALVGNPGAAGALAACVDVRDAWASVPAPPVEDLKYMAWGWGEAAAREFTGVAPMDVNRDSKGFSMAESLLDLPPRAGAAYLGSFLLSALENLELQKSGGVYWNITYRAHIIYYLDLPFLWERLWPFLTPKCREVLVQVALYIASEHEALALTPEKVAAIRGLAAQYSKSA